LYLHCRTPKEQHYRQTITLTGDEAQINFTLADGRRTDSLSDVQLAKAAADQIRIQQNMQHILAQQLAGVNPAVAAALASLGDSSGGIGGGVGTVGPGDFAFPFPIRGAVGYQPVIIMLPAGAMLRVMGVISADRRYVRYSGMPMFMGIGQVQTFNYATGASGSSGGGNTGTGGSGIGGGGGGVF
jgi:hypothetical protein